MTTLELITDAMRPILTLFQIIFLVSVLVRLQPCDAQIQAQPLQARAVPAHQGSLFQSVDAAKAGIDFRHRWNPPAKHRDQLTNAFSGGGLAIGDFDNDGLPDLFFCGSTHGGQLYQNAGGFQFTNQTAILTPAPAAGTWATGATWADIDNDGWLDLYVCGFDSPNRLYLNRVQGKRRVLVESGKQFGVNLHSASVMASFADYDCDGDLDLFVVTNRLPAPDSLRTEKFSLSRGPNGEPVLPEAFRQYADVIMLPGNQGLKQIDAGQYDHLYRNDGPKKPFKDVTQEVGMHGNHYGLSATWWDWNQDGWPDLYVANDFFGPDQLWTNQGPGADGVVTFKDMSRESLPHTPWFSMGSDITDINNDGHLDFLATDMAGSTHYDEKMQMGNMSGDDSDAWFLNFPTPPQYMRNAFYLNSGTDRFMEAANLLGIAKSDWTWSVNFGDLDNDGREDLFITNGMSRDWLNSDLRKKAPSKDGWDRYYDFWYAQPPLNQTNRAFRNEGNLTMTELGKSWGLAKNGVSFGSALSDLDGDGDLDIVVNNFDSVPYLHRNDSAQGHRLVVSLIGSKSNRFGLGTRVTVRFNRSEQILTRYLTSARGFMSSPEPKIHFGLGDHSQVAELSIHWPSGHQQIFQDLKVNQHYTITETNNITQQYTEDISPLFVSSTILSSIRHTERLYDDFARQPLLPNKHSQLGPLIAFADVDGDGKEEFYLSQGAGTAGQVYVRNSMRSQKVANPFLPHAGCEDITPLFFDADGDQDQDLYVVSGGVEGKSGDPVFRDRLYLNDGKGTFKHKANALPNISASGGPVAAADFDKDGDLDLFVGGRVVPGKYPETPQSQLLRNDGSANFEDAAAEFQLHAIGMVTAALWADTNSNGWPDLIAANDWGAVQVFENHKGILRPNVISTLTGWWCSLAAGDLDGDGDTDLVAGNVGLNTKYKATLEKPELLYYGDFDGTGTARLLEAKFENGVCLPRRGYSCSSHAMPPLKARLTTFHDFASRSLEAIYSAPRLEKAQRFEANTLESGIFLNEGNGRFTFTPLPRAAQAFPIYDIAIRDFTSDGNPDLYLIGNSHSPQRETGNMDGGVSLLLRGDGQGQFKAIWPNKSGLVVSGDMKGLAITDLNGDQKPDIVVSINNGPVQAFLAQ